MSLLNQLHKLQVVSCNLHVVASLDLQKAEEIPDLLFHLANWFLAK